MKRPRISLAAWRRITRPLVTQDGRYDRRAIFAEARRRFREAPRWRGRPLTWGEALADAWSLARRQIDYARAIDAQTPLAA